MINDLCLPVQHHCSDSHIQWLLSWRYNSEMGFRGWNRYTASSEISFGTVMLWAIWIITAVSLWEWGHWICTSTSDGLLKKTTSSPPWLDDKVIKCWFHSHLFPSHKNGPSQSLCAPDWGVFVDATLVWRWRVGRWAADRFEHTTVTTEENMPFVNMAETPPVFSCPTHIQTQGWIQVWQQHVPPLEMLRGRSAKLH